MSERCNVRVLGGTWTERERPCAECGSVHNHLTDLSDGRAVCLPCAVPYLRERPSRPKEHR